MLIKILATRVSFTAILVLVLTLVATGEGGRLTAMQEGTMMKDAAVLKTGIPHIDAAAPAKTETATFALG
jgi:hypothetical protein